MSLSSIYRPNEDISNPSLDSVLAKLAVMNTDQLKAFAAEHQDDMVMLGAAQAVHAKRAEYAQKANAPQGGQMPPVNQQVVQGMDPMPQMPPQGMPPQGMPPQGMPPQGMPPQGGGQLPEQQGIAQLPAPNIQNMAGGGIVAFAEGGYADDELADSVMPVMGMAGGGYASRYNDFGAVSAPFEDAFNTTLRYEGGFVKDDAGKGPSNFGINKTANPDVDVENLTKEKAREIYKKRYWDAIGGDSLAQKNPALAKVAFDTAVNMGVSKANKLVADSKGDPTALLNMRQQHYNTLLEKDPEKFSPYAKGWKSRLADLATSIIPSAEAGELPKPAPVPAQPQKAGLESTNAGSNVLAGTMAGTQGLSALQSARDFLTAGFKPGTTAGQASRVLGTAAAVPQAVMLGGAAATKKAMNDLQAMSPEQRREMSSNPMLSAMSGDAGLASAIMDAAANNPQGPSKMPYKEQMTNVGKLLVGHPDIERQRLASEAKKPAAQKAQVGYDPNNMVPISPDEFGPALGISEAAEKKVVDATKEAVPAKERKGFDYETLLTLGLGLMANKSPRFLTALGEAGLQALAGKKEREKAETDTEYKKSQTRQSNAYADYIERGGKEKKMELEAEKLVQDHMEAWEKANKIVSIQNPGARLQEEARARQQIYTNLGIKPIMAGQAAPASSGGFKFVGVS